MALAFVVGVFVGALVVFLVDWWLDLRHDKKTVEFQPSTRPEPKVATVFIQKTAGGDKGKIARVRPVHIRSRRNNTPER